MTIWGLKVNLARSPAMAERGMQAVGENVAEVPVIAPVVAPVAFSVALRRPATEFVYTNIFDDP